MQRMRATRPLEPESIADDVRGVSHARIAIVHLNGSSFERYPQRVERWAITSQRSQWSIDDRFTHLLSSAVDVGGMSQRDTRSDPGQPTLVQRRGARPRSSPPQSVIRERARTGAASASDGSDTPDAIYDRTIAQAVQVEELVRARGFSAVAMFMVALVGVQLPFLPGDANAKLGAALALVVMFVTACWAFVRAGRPAGYTPLVFRVQGWVLATCILPIEYYVGFYSPMTVVLSLGIYYLGQSTDSRHAFWLPIYVALSWIVGALLLTTGVVQDHSVFSSSGLTFYSQVFMAIGVGSTLMTTMWMARVARTSVRRAIVASNDALMMAQKREAQLAEAHNQLDDAIRAAVGKPGRHSGEVAGSYRLQHVIGIGAMGEVYAAEHVQSGEPAAVKLLHRDTLVREDMVARFLREAAVCEHLEHPNVVKVRDVGRLNGGAPYMVMERLQGETLAAMLRARGQLPLLEVVALARALGAGLSHAHERGVVHRDLKPHNLFLHAHGEALTWTILDFGISKLEDSTGTLTRESLVGTPAYMSPEQALGQPVDHRSDVFSMGSVLYRALTGQPAFPGTQAPRIMFDVAYRMPKRPNEQAGDAPPDIDLVFALALAKDRKQRFDTTSAFAGAFEAASTGSLEASLRARARALLEQHPWGSERGP
jgi:serine/threonine-protein kinase